MTPKDLTGEARRTFDSWRALGLSEAAAMDQLRRDGYLGRPVELVEGLEASFRELGMSESAARIAARGHDGAASRVRAPTAAGELRSLLEDLRDAYSDVLGFAPDMVRDRVSTFVAEARQQAGTGIGHEQRILTALRDRVAGLRAAKAGGFNA